MTCLFLKTIASVSFYMASAIIIVAVKDTSSYKKRVMNVIS